MQKIDLRSDTVTRPSEAMRKAIASAEVGDDVYGEDPTVNRLQERAADCMGKEAALFVPSGTMANQSAIAAHTRPGDVVLAGRGAHILRFEAGAATAVSGIQIETLGVSGLFTASEVSSAVAADDVHLPPTTLLALENTHNSAGGLVWPMDELRDVTRTAHDHGMAVHLDGARIFNASVALRVEPREIATCFDSVAFCLSKGLGAPVGSLICGERDFIREAKRARQRLGGALRQSGVLAAAGLYALEHHVERLSEDHENAVRFANGLREVGIEPDATPETNIVMFRVADQKTFTRAAHESGVIINPFDRERMRAVTHLDVTAADIDEAIERIARFTGA
ncbi:MAG: low-specificity L-threonine aldolase [Myxococcota bacterium]